MVLLHLDLELKSEIEWNGEGYKIKLMRKCLGAYVNPTARIGDISYYIKNQVEKIDN